MNRINAPFVEPPVGFKLDYSDEGYDNPRNPMTVFLDCNFYSVGKFLNPMFKAATKFASKRDVWTKAAVQNWSYTVIPIFDTCPPSYLSINPNNFFYSMIDEEKAILDTSRSGFPHHFVLMTAAQSAAFSPAQAPEGIVRYLVTSPIDDTPNDYREADGFDPCKVQTFSDDISRHWKDTDRLFQGSNCGEFYSALENIFERVNAGK
jgi:hypothetical protein